MTALGNKIRATCVIKEKTMRSLSEALKMSHQCLYARLNDDDLWKLSELKKDLPEYNIDNYKSGIYTKYNNMHERTAPIDPIITPSITNGHLINQSVAPTNFMIPTSLLLE